jgi:hypothetical protein
MASIRPVGVVRFVAGLGFRLRLTNIKVGVKAFKSLRLTQIRLW